MQTRQTRKTLIQSIERALNALEVVRERAPLRSTEIARALGLSPSAASNIVRTLFHRGYLAQGSDGRYVLGCQAYLLGIAADAWAPLRQAAQAPMQRLNQETGYLCFLGVEAQGRVIAVRIVEGAGAVVVPRDQKWLDQLHCTAAGKVLLAHLVPERYAVLRATYVLTPQTPATITDWETLDATSAPFARASVCARTVSMGSPRSPCPWPGRRPCRRGPLRGVLSYYLLERQAGLVASLRCRPGHRRTARLTPPSGQPRRGPVRASQRLVRLGRRPSQTRRRR